jgi:hypothetical protein
MTDELVTWGRRAWGALEAVHVPAYFSPEVREEVRALGLHPSLAYFPVRAAAMGAVPAEVVEATFYVFAPGLVRRVVPECWSVAAPEQVLAARHRGVARTLHRLLDPVLSGDTTSGGAGSGDLGRDDLDEAVALARRACEGLSSPGHPLYAGHASLPWPDEPLLQLWHAATLLREHRGDGHVAALVTHGLDPLEAMVTSLLAGSAVSAGFLRRSRGWSDADWDLAVQRLVERGLLSVEGVEGAEPSLTPSGVELRRTVEDATDRAALVAWQHLGAEDTRRLATLIRPLSTAVAASGALDATRAA